MMQRKRLVKRNTYRKIEIRRPRLGLRISKGLQALLELPEGVLSDPEQTILRRIQNIHSGTAIGALTEADYNNMKKIAQRHNVRVL